MDKFFQFAICFPIVLILWCVAAFGIFCMIQGIKEMHHSKDKEEN